MFSTRCSGSSQLLLSFSQRPFMNLRKPLMMVMGRIKPLMMVMERMGSHLLLPPSLLLGNVIIEQAVWMMGMNSGRNVEHSPFVMDIWRS